MIFRGMWKVLKRKQKQNQKTRLVFGTIKLFPNPVSLALQTQPRFFGYNMEGVVSKHFKPVPGLAGKTNRSLLPERLCRTSSCELNRWSSSAVLERTHCLLTLAFYNWNTVRSPDPPASYTA